MKMRNDQKKATANPVATSLRIPPDMTDEVLFTLTGMHVCKPEDAPFYGADEAIIETPALKLRASKDPGEPGVWTIVDHLDARERLALSDSMRRVRISTGCSESDLDGARHKFVAYLREKLFRLAANVSPASIPVPAVLFEYQQHLEHGGHNLGPTTVETYLNHMVPIMEAFGQFTLGFITTGSLKTYEVDRRGKPNRNKPGKNIGATNIAHEIATFRQAVNHFCQVTNSKYAIKWYFPKRDTVLPDFWTRPEIARYLWACRGRIWLNHGDAPNVPPEGRWKIARDDDPTLVGSKGDVRVLRDVDTIARREAETRRVLTAIYTASRSKVLYTTAWRPGGGRPYVSQIEGVVRRRPLGEGETNKRRPPVALSDKMARFMLNWAYQDAQKQTFRYKAPGRPPVRVRPALTVLHREDGSPVDDYWFRNTWTSALKDCGIDKPINNLVLRHTAATWMKIEGLSAWLIAEFLGCSVDVVVERYGCDEMYTSHQAANTLARGHKQKASQRRLRKRGLRAA